eukprot:3941406-Rhodomonas_salina.2
MAGTARATRQRARPEKRLRPPLLTLLHGEIKHVLRTRCTRRAAAAVPLILPRMVLVCACYVLHRLQY